MRTSTLEQHYLGSMIGGALGDAIGEMAFATPGRRHLEGRVQEALILRYTDDTAMSIGLAESIVQNGALDSRHLGDTFRRNYNREPWRGYASGPPTVFSLVAAGKLSYEQAAASLFGGSGSFGNGAAMRSGPLGLFYHGSPELYERCRQASAVTHSHPVGIDGAAIQARAVDLALEYRTRRPMPVAEFLDGLQGFGRSREMLDRLATLRQLLTSGAGAGEAAASLGRGVAVQDSLPFALYAFLTHPDSFEECLFCAILNGGDRDTLGAMACAVAGARVGLAAIPERWRHKLENHHRIEGLAAGLYAAFRRSRPCGA
ncbi:MAG: ADP-ribosylglycohydrolase family protein [Spirochaetales bacterium]|nr:ADP-ribosylglycohydrolase family protein [Spirochaetales bacterium]